MPKVSIHILTKNRAPLLRKALYSVCAQSFGDFEVVIVNDGSTDDTAAVLEEYAQKLPLVIITHGQSRGIIASRQEALLKSAGEYIAILDDDDEWIDADKLKKQLWWFEQNSKGVLVGSAVEYKTDTGSKIVSRPKSDYLIRRTMLLRNNFFTSTVMFKKAAALQSGGFIADGVDVAEDYHLWLRLGQLGQMGNFRQVFTAYRAIVYTKGRFKMFLTKQLSLIGKYKQDYPFFWLSSLVLKLRIYV